MHKLSCFFRGCCIVAAIALTAVSLGSCQLAKNQITYDRSSEKDIQDYRDALTPRALPPADASADAPDFQPVISTPEDLKLPSPLVTVSVNQTVSLRDLMFELAEQAGIDLEMDPQIRGSIIFTAKERPFNDVVERICEMAGLRYEFKNGVLRVELDRPYVKNYKVDYMNVARTASSGITTSISVSSDAQAGSSSSGSNASITTSYSGDHWKELDTGLKQILTSSDLYVSLATLADPVATPVAPPPPLPVDPTNPNAVQPASTVPPSLSVSVPSASGEPLIPNPPSTYSISKQTGVVTVFATERQHHLVQRFLDTLRRISMTQILIEAKVMEVSLTDEFAAGIDWGAVSHNITGLAAVRTSLTSPGFSTPSSNVFTARFDLSNDLKPVITALSRFGTVRALSSPRVTVMNNQPAAVNVSRNKVYFEITTTTTPCSPSPCSPTITQSGTTKTAPEGVLMSVVPTADADTGEIILAVRPTVSKIATQVDDPINPGNSIPELSVQEIDSIIKMQSGQTLVMGGLMKDTNDASQEGVPVLGDLPMVGSLFRNHGDIIQKSELVIFLQATIVPGNNVDEMDRKLYKNFAMDHRPSRL